MSDDSDGYGSQVVYEPIDDYIAMESLNRQPSPYVDPTRSPIYSNLCGPSHAMPPNQAARPRPRLGPKSKKVGLLPPPPSTPPPSPDTGSQVTAAMPPNKRGGGARRPPKVSGGDKAAQGGHTKVPSSSKSLPNAPPTTLPPRQLVRQYTPLSLAGPSSSSHEHEYDSLKPHPLRKKRAQRYSKAPPTDKHRDNIPLQNLYDDSGEAGHRRNTRLLGASEEVEKEGEDDEGSRVDSPRVVCLLLTITIVALLIAVVSLIATMYCVTSIEKIKRADDALVKKRRCYPTVVYGCSNYVDKEKNPVLCPPARTSVLASSERTITCEATYTPHNGDLEMPTKHNIFVATVLRYSQDNSTYIQCACFSLPKVLVPSHPPPPPPSGDNGTSHDPVTMDLFTYDNDGILNCTMYETHC